MGQLRPVTTAAAVALLLALSVGGCNKADGVIRETPGPRTATASPSASASPTSATEEQRILAQYKTFWTLLTPASLAPESQRRAMFQPYATDPELTRVLSGLRASDNLGQVLYGAVVTRPVITKISSGVAYVRDCQDASRHGRKARDTGAIVTRGTTHDLAMVTLKRGSDGVWRLATVHYPRGAKC